MRGRFEPSSTAREAKRHNPNSLNCSSGIKLRISAHNVGLCQGQVQTASGHELMLVVIHHHQAGMLEFASIVFISFPSASCFTPPTRN